MRVAGHPPFNMTPWKRPGYKKFELPSIVGAYDLLRRDVNDKFDPSPG